MNKLKKMKLAIKNFFVPQKHTYPLLGLSCSKNIIAVIPTYKASKETLKFITSLLAVPKHDKNKKIKVVVVDDYSSSDNPSQKIFEKIASLAKKNRNLYLIRTPKTTFKPGALNFGLKFIKSKNLVCDVVITSDDDVIVERRAISRMVDYLFSNDKFGAVTSFVKVKNKNKNLLTRLQSLEYYNYNTIKIADNGYFQGPLVMQGMLTAFRYKAIQQIRGYSQKNLIEDYEITAKLKKKGWLVGICQKAVAWTDVPESFSRLWRQRVRWSYWGLWVVKKYIKHPFSVLQDIIGHFLFISLSLLIAMSFFIPTLDANPLVVKALVIISLEQFLITYTFSVLTLIWHENTDRFDWIIRIILIPELVYSTVLSLVVYGSYLFFAYNNFWEKTKKFIPSFKKVYKRGLKIFSQFGYSLSWGTR